MKPLLFFALLLCCLSAGAQTVTNLPLEWNHVTAVKMREYRVYQGVQSGVYTNVTVVPPQLWADVPAVYGVTNYFTVTAVEPVVGLESDRCVELAHWIPAPPGVKPGTPTWLRVRVPLFQFKSEVRSPKFEVKTKVNGRWRRQGLGSPKGESLK